MLAACAGVRDVSADSRRAASPSGMSFAGEGSVQGAIDQVERRAARNLEASNAAIAAHIGALSERLNRVERGQREAAAAAPHERAGPVLPAPVQTRRQPDAVPDVDADGDDRSKPEGRLASQEPGRAASLDPDEQQRAYAEFIATTQKNLNCIGVHTWSLCAATRVNSTCAGSCLALVPSLLLLVVQCFVLHAMSLESLHPTCSRNSDCRVGMWCAPSRSFEGLSRSPGMCDDCRWAGKLEIQEYDSLPSRYDAEAYAVMTSSDLASGATLSDATSHCDATDTMPDQCDWLKDFQEQLTLAPFVVFICVTGVMLAFLIVDMDKQAQIADVFAYREKSRTGKLLGPLITMVAWLIYCLRKFVLPGVVVYTFSALVLAGPPTPGVSLPVSFVLNGLAVAFIYNVDSLLALAFLDENAQALIREAFADMEAHDSMDIEPGDMIVQSLPYFFHRFLAICFGCLIMVNVLTTESLMDSMSLFTLDWDELPGRFVLNPSAKSCTNVVTMLGTSTLVVTTFFSLIWSVTHQISVSCRRWGPLDVVFAPVVALVTMPALSYVLLKIGYASIG